MLAEKCFQIFQGFLNSYQAIYKHVQNTPIHFQWELKYQEISMGTMALLTIVVGLRFQDNSSKNKWFDASLAKHGC